MSPTQESRVTTVQQTTDTAFAMALLWAVPVMAFLLALTRM